MVRVIAHAQKGAFRMARSHGERRFWGQLGRAAAIVPIAAAVAAPILPAQAAAAASSGKTALVTPLKKIMNPKGRKPVGTDCIKALLFGLDKKAVTARIFCKKTTGKHIQVWGFQFDSKKHYLAGVRHINAYTGFSGLHHGTTCPPATSKGAGITGWHANSNPKYRARRGQNIECFIDNGNPVLIWTMPTQHVFFIAQLRAKHPSQSVIVEWWKTVNYG
jgi:hypothetical protein